MANRKRNIQMKFYVTEEEKRLIDEKMAQLPTRRYGAYLRKMAIDGYNAAHFRPQTAFIRKAPSLPRGGEGLAGKAAGNDGDCFKSCFLKKCLLRKSVWNKCAACIGTMQNTWGLGTAQQAFCKAK